MTPPLRRRRRDAGTGGRGGDDLHVPVLPRVLGVAEGGALPPPRGLAARVVHRGVAVDGGGDTGRGRRVRRVGGVLRVARRMTTDDVVPGAASSPMNTTNNVLLGATGDDVVLGATAVTGKTA